MEINGRDDYYRNPENVAWKEYDPTNLVKRVFEKGVVKPGQKALDLGCGFGRNANFLQSKGVEVVGVNISKSELEIARDKAKEVGLQTTFVEASATDLPMANESMDVVIDSGCTHMLDQEQQKKAIEQIKRVLKVGGYVVYFGFSKDHPASVNNTRISMYRNLEDIIKQFGEDYEVVSNETVEWKPLAGEQANFDVHKGLNVILRKKIKVTAL